jgi:3-oxoacyl-[acyl-carrier protein] reductase
MDGLYEAAVKQLGGVDILLINHPGPALGLAADICPEHLARQFAMAVLSPIRLISRALPGMRSRRWGRIVSVGGASIIQPVFNKITDNIVRPALVGYFKSLANEVAADGITANVLIPGIFMSDRVRASTAADAELLGLTIEQAMSRRLENIPAGRFGELSEFEAVAAFLCSERASFVNGSIVRVDGSQIKSIV